MCLVCSWGDRWYICFKIKKEKWLRRFPRLPNGIPPHDTFRRVFMLINTERFGSCYPAWTRTVFTPPAKHGPGRIAVDGKTMRRSFDRARETLLSMWSARCGQRVCDTNGADARTARGFREMRGGPEGALAVSGRARSDGSADFTGRAACPEIACEQHCGARRGLSHGAEEKQQTGPCLRCWAFCENNLWQTP